MGVSWQGSIASLMFSVAQQYTKDYVKESWLQIFYAAIEETCADSTGRVVSKHSPPACVFQGLRTGELGIPSRGVLPCSGFAAESTWEGNALREQLLEGGGGRPLM